VRKRGVYISHLGYKLPRLVSKLPLNIYSNPTQTVPWQHLQQQEITFTFACQHKIFTQVKNLDKIKMLKQILQMPSSTKTKQC